MRKQPEILHHKADFAPLRRQSGHVAAPDRYPAAVRPMKAGDGFQRDRFAGAVRPEEDQNFAAGDREVDAVEAERAKGQAQRFDRDAGRHRFSRSGAPRDSARNRRNNASETKSNSTAALAA